MSEDIEFIKPEEYPPPSLQAISELEKIITEIEYIKPYVPPPKIPELPKVNVVAMPNVVIEPSKNYIYKEIDLTQARTDEPLGLRGLGIVATFLSCKRADSSFSIKLNKTSADSIDLEKGDYIDGFKIEEVYVTVPPGGTGKAKLFLSW